MDFNRLNKLKPLVKSKIKKEASRLFLVKEKKVKKKSKIIPLNARGQRDIKCAREHDESYYFAQSQECLLMKMQEGNCSPLRPELKEGQHFIILPAPL